MPDYRQTDVGIELWLLVTMLDDSAHVHTSRHFLDRQAHHIKFVPFAEGGPADDAAPGVMMAHRLFVTGGWRQELKVRSDQFQHAIILH